MAASNSRKLRRIIKEHIRQIEAENPKLKQLREFYAKDLTDPNHKPTIWKGGIGEKRWNTLTNLGAQPYDLGINPDGLQLDVNVTDPTGKIKTKRQDRLWFYSTGYFYSSNQARHLYYKVSPTSSSTILVYTDKTYDEQYLVGNIIKVGSVAEYNITNKLETEKPLSAGEKAVDIFQTILDWIGFVPGIGDIADLVNAVISFIRGNIFEGLLSLIAVIPIIGSGVKVVFKGAMDLAKSSIKGFERALRASFKSGDTYELWDSIVKSGKFSKSTLKELGTGLGSIRGVFKKSTDPLKDLPGGDTIAKDLDKLSAWMKNSEKNIDELSRVAKQSAETAARRGTTINRTITQATDVAQQGSKKILSIIPSVKADGLFKRLRGLAWFPEKKLVALGKGMERKFAKNMAHPTKLMTLVKLTPNPEQLMNNMIYIKGFKELVQKEFPKMFTDSGLLHHRSAREIFRSQNAKKLQNLFREASKDPGMWREVADEVATHAMKNDSPIWSLYKTDALKSLATSLDPRYMKGFYDTGFRKNVDIIYNELQDMGEDITKDEIQDNPTGVIYPIIKSGLNQILPGDTVNDVQSYRDKIAKNPYFKAGLATVGYSVKNDGAIVKTKNLDYNPFAEADVANKYYE